MNTRRFVRPSIDTLNYLTTSAKLIWHPSQRETYYDKPVNSYCQFRYRFILPEQKAVSSTFRMFADSKYALYINGKYVTKGPARSDPNYQYYDAVDVTSYLLPGENVLAVLALYYGYGTGHSMNRVPCFFLDGDITLESGETVAVKSGDGWVCQLCDAFIPNPPRVNGCKGPCQLLDNRKYNKNWVMPDFDDGSWIKCHLRTVNRESPFRNLLERPTPQLVEHPVVTIGSVYTGIGTTVPQIDNAHMHLAIKEECTTMKLNRHAPHPLPQDFPSHSDGEFSVICLDFGKVTAGYLNLEIDGEDGAILDVIFSEHNFINGKPTFDGISYRPLSRFVLREGINQLENFFHYDALRYAYLIYRGNKATVHNAWLSAVEYPYARRSQFQCPDQKLQKLWDICTHTIVLSMQDGFLDSPSREQQQWMGDARWQALYNAYMSGDMRMLKKLLYQFAQSQDYEGMTCSRYPDENCNLAPIPTYCLQWICAFGDYYSFTGDLKPIDDLYDHMIRAARWFTAFQREDGLVWDLPYWAYHDRGTSKSGVRADYFDGALADDNLMLLEAVTVMHRFAQLLGDKEAEEFYGQYSSALAKSIHKYFWSDEYGCIVDCVREGHVQSAKHSELSNALALVHLYEPGSKEAESIINNLIGVTDKSDDYISLDLYSMPVLIRGLVRHNRAGLAYHLVREKYTQMLSDEMDATSTWEHFELYTTDGSGNINGQRSACHGWGASGIMLIAEALCGVQFKDGKAYLVDSGVEDIDLDNFSAVLQMPGIDENKGYILRCDYQNGKLIRTLENP